MEESREAVEGVESKRPQMICQGVRMEVLMVGVEEAEDKIYLMIYQRLRKEELMEAVEEAELWA